MTLRRSIVAADLSFAWTAIDAVGTARINDLFLSAAGDGPTARAAATELFHIAGGHGGLAGVDLNALVVRLYGRWVLAWQGAQAAPAVPPRSRERPVVLEFGQWRIPLRFTWSVIDLLTPVGITTRLKQVGVGAPGEMTAIAELLAAASVSQVTPADLLRADIPIQKAAQTLVDAWVSANRRFADAPPREEEEPEAGPSDIVEQALSMALAAGVAFDHFWRMTPYEAGLAARAYKIDRRDGYLMTGWFGERFHREDKLSGPAHYITEFFDSAATAEVEEAMAMAEFERMARTWGLEIVDIEDEEGGPGG